MYICMYMYGSLVRLIVLNVLHARMLLPPPCSRL